MNGTARRIRRLRARDGDGCFFCGRPIDFEAVHNMRWAPSVHHLQKRADGGSNRLSNLVLAHCRCHRRHHAKEDEARHKRATFGAGYWRGLDPVIVGDDGREVIP